MLSTDIRTAAEALWETVDAEEAAHPESQSSGDLRPNLSHLWTL